MFRDVGLAYRNRDGGHEIIGPACRDYGRIGLGVVN